MTNSTISITTEQSQYLQTLLASQDYPAAYLYLKEIVASDPHNDQRLADWLGKAAHINSNDGTFYSDLVRGATINAAQNEGEVVTEEDFQIASDLLAKSIIEKITKDNVVPKLDDIIKIEVQDVVKNLDLLPQSWAGTAMAWAPYLGLDLDLNSQFYTDLFKEYRDAPSTLVFFNGGILFQQLLDNNLTGLANATESQLTQLLEATMDHVNGTDVSDNPILDLIKDSLNSLLTTATTISSATQLIFNTLLSAEQSIIPRRVDPLTLDLDNDGIELVSVNDSTAFFDLDVTADLDANGNPTGTYTSDGVKEQVGWVSSDDGLLTLDRNGNGTVDNILELFGKTNKTGTEELREYDLNNAEGANGISDGKIDSSDAIFSQLKIWQDLNQNGISEASELSFELVAEQNH